MSKLFTTVKKAKVKRSSFNLSEEVKLSCNFGQIIPICLKETLPGDVFKISTELLIKLAPLQAPVMHRLKAKVDYFYVPNFQLTKVFEKFINPKVNTSANPVVLPYFTPSVMAEFCELNSLADYFGLPVTQLGWLNSGNDKLTPLPFMAYQHIYNCYFRDQNAEKLPSEGGPVAAENTLFVLDDLSTNIEGDIAEEFSAQQLESMFILRNCCWKKDYFTSALPSPQAGDDVMIPIGAPVTIGADGFMKYQVDPDESEEPLPFTGFYPEYYEEGSDDRIAPMAINDNGGSFLYYKGGLKGESTGAGVSINNLRKLFSLQRFKELAERGGTRYIEILRNFFGETAPDLYFDRPAYLGGSVQPITIGETVQTSSSTEDSAQGHRAGIANSYGKTKTVKFRSRFHGYLIGVLRIIPEATYQQGVERMWTRKSIYDFAWPQFANLGEQEIYNKEIYANGDSHDDEIFGYTPRYAEYKESHCHVCGEFRTTLNYWHFGRQFANLPQLNKAFLNMDTMNYTPFNVTEDETSHCYVNLYNKIYAKRNLPYYGTPSLL